MLKQLGRLERTRNIIILLFAILMAVSLVIFYAPGRSANNNIDATRNTDVVAKVGSARITVADVARMRENYAQMLGGRISLAQLGGNKRLLDNLISTEVVTQEAVRLGLGASDAEVAEKIRKQVPNVDQNIERYKESMATR